MSGCKSTLVMWGTGVKERDMISAIGVSTNLRKLWEGQEQRDEIWLVLYEWVQIYASYKRNRSKFMDEIWSVLYEWEEIYASYERNRSKGTRYDQFYMSGYKSTPVIRGTGAKGRDMISSIWVGTNLRQLWDGQEQRDEIWSVIYEWVQIYASYERNRRKGTRYDQFYISGYKSMLVIRRTGVNLWTRYDQFYISGYKSTLVMRGTGAKGRDMISSIWVGTNLC